MTVHPRRATFAKHPSRALAPIAISLVALSVAFAAARPLPAQAFAPSAAAEPLMLRADDSVRITVWHHPELSGTFALAPDGSVAHPLYKAVRLGGVPLSELNQRVHDFLTRFDADPQFVIEPYLRIAVGGQVKHPGIFAVRPGMTVSQAIVLAGDVTDDGRSDQVQLVRDGRRTTVHLNSDQLATALMPVRSGDELVVPKKRALWRDFFGPAVTVLGATAAIVTAIARVR
ncbi:MAG TPA: polysaccharide biosynthesis/export family protein [Gemmatimonadaceae bacterium]|nr:polysaccharide biosynthesis/export family protein [Gemmatimonadaceae bacterium]